MNKRIKKLWLKTLRSGDYKQGHGYLHPTHDQYCCLGVLCDIYLKEKGEQWITEGGDEHARCMPEDYEKFFPSSRVMFWAGINGVKKLDSLVVLNDECVPFKDIAKRIEVDF